MDQHPTTDNGAQEVPEFCGSAWAVLDETFFRLTQDLFSHTFCMGASTLLATNDDAPRRVTPPSVISLPDQPTWDEATVRRAAMYRHPSARRRF